MENPFEILEKRIIRIEQLLLEIKGDFQLVVQPTENVNDNLTISEAASYLKVSKVTIHKYKNNALFPFYQGGGTVYFKKSEIDEALSSKVTNKRVR